jgi:Superfamily I DNA and RNA helicases and helicase subunits
VLEDGETEVWFSDLLVPVPFERRTAALGEVERSDRKRALITGDSTVRFDVSKYALPESEIELNEHQRTALVWAHGAEDVVCIHGPPGTGKTRTLTAYVESAVERGQSVLVTAHSNQAVDNLLVGDSTPNNPEEETLHALARDPDRELSIARVGGNSRNAVVQQTYMDRPPRGADVVAATTSGAAQFDQDQFDVAVVDEATQASRPATAIAINCAQKLVLAGDHKQLPPYCADEGMQEEESHISLFEYLLKRCDDEISVLLRTQYRMNEEIAEFPNSSFYDRTLETADRNRNWTVGNLAPLCGIDIVGNERQQSAGNSYYNPTEAEAVARQVQRLVENGLSPEDIGVISAYSGQVRRIRREINGLDIRNARRLSVDTVDSYQGSEREAVIVSFVRSNDYGHSGFLEFPEGGPRRLNVALTRARRRLVLIGDWDTLGTVAPHRTETESCAPLYAALSEHLRTHGRMLQRRK